MNRETCCRERASSSGRLEDGGEVVAEACDRWDGRLDGVTRWSGNQLGLDGTYQVEEWSPRPDTQLAQSVDVRSTAARWPPSDDDRSVRRWDRGRSAS